MKRNSISKTKFIVYTALMAALCYAATYVHIKFSLGGATSSTMIHLGSAAAFLAAMLLGGMSGGLAGGIGMGLFDLLNGFPTTAPWTLVIKFLTGFIAGKIAFSHGKNGENQKNNLLACLAGGGVSLVGYAVCDFVNTLIAFAGARGFGKAVTAGLIASGSGMVGSILTTLLAVIIAVPLNDSIRKALKSSHLL